MRELTLAEMPAGADPHGQPPAKDAQIVRGDFAGSLDGLLDAPLGELDRPTTIRDALTGAVIRA